MEEREREKSKYIPMYYSYIEQLGLLSLEQVGALMMALLKYGQDGIEPDFPRDGNLYMAFSFIADNSRRAELRGMDLSEKRKVSGRKGGQTTVSKAERNEKGEFISSKQNPSKPKQTQATQATQAYNNNNNNNNNNNDNNNRRYTRACARDDDVDDSQREILSYCREVVGSMSKSQEKKILDAAEGMAFDDVINAISVAWDYDAKTPEFIADTIRTQKEKPERCPGKIW